MAHAALHTVINIADQIEACREISRTMRISIGDIAAQLGISLKDARARIQLSTVSPQIIALFRQGHIDLAQVEALSISADFQAQEAAVFQAINEWAAEPEQLRLLLSPASLPLSHPVVSFVGIDTYKSAGGFIQRDLFADESAGLLADRPLLVRLAAQKLTAIADRTKAEGWGWVATGSAVRFGFAELPCSIDLPTEEDWIKLPKELLAVAGALVGLDDHGNPFVRRGLVRDADLETARRIAFELQNAGLAPAPAVTTSVDPDDEACMSEMQHTAEPALQTTLPAPRPEHVDRQQRSSAVVEVDPVTLGPDDYRIQPGQIERVGTWKETAARNIQIVGLVKSLESDGRAPTDEERALLTRYTGWGASEIANGLFGTGYRPDWKDLADRLKAVLSGEEYSEAKRTTQYAHYTSETIISGIYSALTRLGFAGGSILEPGMGIGLFKGLMPPAIAAKSTYTGIEYDTLSATIAQLLYPRSRVIAGDYAKTALPRDFFDIAIGNPPFSQTRVLNDPEYKSQSFMLHDYFVAKTVDRVRPGGLVALISSKGTLDKKNSKARRYLAERADLVAAVRLPQTAFKDNAGTQVVTDILFLRKRMSGEKLRPTGSGTALYKTNSHGEAVGQPVLHLNDWMNTVEITVDGHHFEINEYFHNHPEMVLGRHSVTGTMHRAFDYSVEPFPDVSIEAALNAAILTLPEAIYTDWPDHLAGPSVAPAGPTVDLDPAHRKVGGIYLAQDGTVMQFEDGIGRPLTCRINATGKEIQLRPSELSWLKGYIRLRDALKRAQADQLEDRNWELSLRTLNETYDAFVKAHGHILAYSVIERDNPDGTTTPTKRFKNEPLIRIDAEGALVYALETISEDGEIHKGPVLRGRVLKRDQEPAINTTQDALFVSLNRLGKLDLHDVARLAQLTEAEVITDLGPTIYQDPAGGHWLMADEYLSGNVVQKLKDAIAAANLDGRYKRNVTALMNVQPKQLSAPEITIRLGTNWIPCSDIRAFTEEVIGDRMQISYTQALGAWTVTCHAHAVSEWTFDRMKSSEILDAILNSRQIKIYDRDEDGTSHLNIQATEKANDIAIKMREAFQTWIWTDSERTERLVAFYNENFNNIAPRTFDGSHLTLPGLSLRFKPYAHQKRAIWRIIQQGDVYLAHTVGAGKAQPLDAKVLTPDGWVKMGDIRPGDFVIAGDGTPTRVEATYPQGEKDIYRVVFSDGSATECCDEHLWLTQTYKERSASQTARKMGKDWPSGYARVRALAEIRATLVAPHLGAKNHSIPMTGAVQFASRGTRLDPYLMGVLLGDGGMCGTSVIVTSADQAILDAVSSVLPQDCELQYRGQFDYSIAYRGKMKYAVGGGMAKSHPVMNALRAMNLWGLPSHEKFIPGEYLINSVETRVAILQGLMDTDGWVSKRGHSIYFTSSSRALADGVAEIVQSLGGTVSIKEKRPFFRVDGVRKPGRVAYNVCLKLPGWVTPFRLQRKAELVKPKTIYAPVRYIVAVDHVGRKEAQCIRVAHPDHLYVTDDFIVTHNTFEMIAGAMEQKRLGLISKPMFAVPNHMLVQFAREFLELYPAANILVADEHNFHTHNRRRFVAQAALNAPDAIIITHSAFGRIGMSKEFYADFVGRQVQEWEELLDDVDSGDRRTRKQIERRIEALERRLEARQSQEKKDQVLTFEELGVDFLLIDESHDFRKLDFATNQGNIKGIDPAGSQRALDLFMKVAYLREGGKGRALVMASGTPITNTMGELFTIQRFFQPEQLAQDGLSSFDAWAAQYGDIVAGFEQNAAGGYEIVSRFAKFYNVPELMRRVRSFMDILTSKSLGELVQRPAIQGGQRQIIVTPVPDGYKAYQKELEERIQAIRNRSGRPQPGDDIILSVISDGRFSAIDMRFVYPDLPSDPDSKLNRMLDDAITAYHETANFAFVDPHTNTPEPNKGATLIIFTDIGLGEQSAANRGFDMKAWIQHRLVQGGVKPEHIAFMRDYKQHAKKERLFAEMRDGRKRVLVGGKDMETGVNVQKRLYDLFHLDAPWFPASVQQREGRIERQGNQNQTIRIRAYATKGSYDSTMWGMNARKARFIEQAMNGDDTIRSMDDVSEASTFQMAAALASGDERYMKVAGLRSDIERLERLRHAHISDQSKLRSEKYYAERTIEGASSRIQAIQTAIQKRQPVPAGEFSGLVNDRTHEKREDFGRAVLKAVAEHVGKATVGARSIGHLAGFDLVYVGHKAGNHRNYSAEVYMDLPGDQLQLVSYPFDDEIAPGGIATRALNQVAGLERLLANQEDDLAHAKRRIEQIKNRLGLPFPEEALLNEKSAELDALEVELAAEKTAQAQPTEGGEDPDGPGSRTDPIVTADMDAAAMDYNQFVEPPPPANDDAGLASADIAT